MKKLILIFVVGVGMVWPTAARAGSITFTGSGFDLATGQALSASATFAVVNSTTLSVTLTNTSSADVLAPGDVLTAVFFKVVANPSMTPLSANSGTSTILFCSAATACTPPSAGNVGGEWAYATGIAGPNGADKGIGSAGFGVFGNANFSGPNLQGPIAVDGVQFGITSAGDDPTTGNAAVTGGNALIKNSVTYKLTGSFGTFNPAASIYNVNFQYGTAFTDTNLTGATVPEPGTCFLFGSGLALIARRRLKHARRR